MAGLHARHQVRDGLPRRIEGQHQRPDLGAQEMIGAGSAERGEAGEFLAAHEIQHRFAVVEMSDLEGRGGCARWKRGDWLRFGACPHSTRARNHPANRRHDPRSHFAAAVDGECLRGHRAEGALAAGVLGQPQRGAIDDVERVLVTGLGRVGPGEQAMCLEHRALELRILLRELAQLQAKLVARADPGQPADFPAKYLFGQRPGIGRGRDGDERVGMHVIDVRPVDQAMQRRVDAGRARIQVESAVRVQRHQRAVGVLVGGLRRTVELLQRPKFLHVQRGETIQLHGAQVATRPLDPEHIDLSPGQRILFADLCRSIAATKIGNALVAAEQI